MIPKVGDKIPLWCSGSPDGLSTVMAVLPYRGPLACVKCILRITALRTKRGWLEISWTD